MTYPINYDTRDVGVPYVRVPRIVINYPPPGSVDSPDVQLLQQWAVKIASGSIVQLGAAGSIETPIDATSQAPVPLIDVDSGAPLPQATRDAIAAAVTAGVVTMPIAMLVVLAVVRSLQPPAEG